MLGSQCVELGVGLQSADKSPVFGTQFVHHGGNRVARIEPTIYMLGDRVSVIIGFVDKAFHAVGSVNLTLAKGRVNEAVA